MLYLHYLRRVTAGSRQECMERCAAESSFVCRAALWQPGPDSCRLARWSGRSFSHKLLSTDLQMCLNLSMFRDVVPASSLSSARSGGMLYMENNCVYGEQ